MATNKVAARSSTPASTRAETSTRPTPTGATLTRTTKTVSMINIVLVVDSNVTISYGTKSLNPCTSS